MAHQTIGAPHPPEPEQGRHPGQFEAQLIAWVQHRIVPNWQSVLLGACIVVVALMYAVSWARSRGQEKLVAMGAVYETDALSELRELAAEYRGRAPGEVAALRLARQLFDQERYGEAAEAFGALLVDYPESRLGPVARLGKAYALQATGKLQAAEEAFDAARDAAVDSTLQAEAAVGAGRSAQADGRLEAARRHYEDALAAGVEGLFKDEAMAGLRELKMAGDVPAMAPDTTPEAVPAETAPEAEIDATPGAEVDPGPAAAEERPETGD